MSEDTVENIVVKTVGVTKIYNPGKPNEVEAVRNVSLEVHRGTLVVLKGPSGSGKTTLLSMIGCQTKPTRGEVILLGKRISKLPERFLTVHKRRSIGFIFQQFQLLTDMTVLDNVTLPLIPEGVGLKERLLRADRILEMLDLIHRKDFKVASLSGGEQQRVAIARALINDAPVLLADEPTAHLDSRLAEDLLKYINEIKKSGRTILIATHDPIIYDQPAVDRIYEVRDGQIVS